MVVDSELSRNFDFVSLYVSDIEIKVIANIEKATPMKIWIRFGGT